MKKFLFVIGLLATSAVATAAQTSLTKPAAPASSPKPDNKAAHTATTASSKSGINLPAEKANPVKLPKFEKPPVIDGKLDDEIWKSAVVLKDFYQVQPGDNTAPSKPTEVLLGRDAHFLYIAFHCFDDPTKVRANIPKRDNIFDNSYFGVIFATFKTT